jgi:hypothetical protein
LITFTLAALLPAALAAQGINAPGLVGFTNAAVTPGVWSYRPFAGGSDALFTDSGGAARLAVRCTRASRQVTISRVAPVAAASLFVWTSSAQRTLAARVEPATMRVSADLPARDGLLDAIAFSRGRFAISMPGAPPLVVQPAPEAARVFEDCRN